MKVSAGTTPTTTIITGCSFADGELFRQAATGSRIRQARRSARTRTSAWGSRATMAGQRATTSTNGVARRGMNVLVSHIMVCPDPAAAGSEGVGDEAGRDMDHGVDDRPVAWSAQVPFRISGYRIWSRR